MKLNSYLLSLLLQEKYVLPVARQIVSKYNSTGTSMDDNSIVNSLSKSVDQMRSFTSYFFQSTRLIKISVVVSSSWQHRPDELDEWQIDELARTEHGESFLTPSTFWTTFLILHRSHHQRLCLNTLQISPCLGYVGTSLITSSLTLIFSKTLFSIL